MMFDLEVDIVLDLWNNINGNRTQYWYGWLKLSYINRQQSNSICAKGKT